MLVFAGALMAQEGGGQAELGVQQYYLSMGSQPVANISGVALNFSQFVPDVGLFSASLSPALSNNRFQTGDNYLRLKGLPWKGQYWNVGLGDFYMPGQLLPSPFTNIYMPQIAGRGVSIEASHKGRTFGLFFGTGTIANTPRVALRLAVPQTLTGFHFKQNIGSRLSLGARYLHFSNDLAALRESVYLSRQTRSVKAAGTLGLGAVYTVSKAFKWYTEAAWSTSKQETPNTGSRNVPFSILAGPVLETRIFTVRANYTYQSPSYFPLLGFYAGDRKGPFGEVRVRPLRWLEVYGSGSKYENNVAQDRNFPTFRSSSESAGASVSLPVKLFLNGQFTVIDLSSRENAQSPWVKSKNRQQMLTLSRPFARHSLRVTALEFKQESHISPQRQRSAEIQDILHVKHLLLGGGIKIQRLNAKEPRTTLFYRGLIQFQVKRFSAYANFENGDDMQNRTLFATNTVSTKTFGTTLGLSTKWEFQAEAFRNSSATELNPQSIFALQGRGVIVPGPLASLNQWSIYFRMNRKFRWGKAGAASDLAQYAVRQTSLKGTIEGFVVEHIAEGDQPVEGIVVSLDQGRTATTDAAGRFRFADIAEGSHRVSLATDELLAEFDPGQSKEKTVAVHASKIARVDLDVIRLGLIQGKVIGPAQVPLENIVVRLAGTERYTTPDGEGNFYFYNIRQGDYTVAIDEKTLPEYAVLTAPGRVSVQMSTGRQSGLTTFQFEIHKPKKPVRKVFEKK